MRIQLAIRFILFAFAMFLCNCSGNQTKTIKTDIAQEPKVIEVSIGGMSCTDCEQTIQTRVGKLEGIKSVKASYTAGSAIIEFFPNKVDSVKIREVIAASGYTVKKFIIP